MKYRYLNLTLPTSNRRVKPTEREIITVSFLTNRIYVSITVFRRLNLRKHRISIVQDTEHLNNLYLCVDDENGFELMNYRWCYYINSKSVVQAIEDHLQIENELNSIEFNVDKKHQIIENKKMYKLTPIL